MLVGVLFFSLQLSTVSLNLLLTMIELNCEDVILQLSLRLVSIRTLYRHGNNFEDHISVVMFD